MDKNPKNQEETLINKNIRYIIYDIINQRNQYFNPLNFACLIF